LKDTGLHFRARVAFYFASADNTVFRQTPIRAGTIYKGVKTMKFLSLSFTFLCLVSLAGICGAQIGKTAEKKVRAVKDRVLTSTEMPAVRLKFGKSFKYAGAQDFILYEVARAEQHFFVEADDKNNIKRLYWIQFEGYLPTNNHSYDYESPKIVNLGGLDFFADTYARNVKQSPGRPDSDGSRARAFLESKGYKMGENLLMQRLVHLIDKEKRHELMLIYLEDMSGTGLTAADLAKGGRAEAKWSEVSDALLARARKDLEVLR
jgi:hypothetical protein